MEQEDPSSTSRKVKFAPKATPRRKPQQTLPKTEEGSGEDEASQAQYLLRRFNENLARRGSKVEKKSSVQVAFGPGAASPTTIRTYGVAKEGSVSKRSGTELKDSDNEESLLPISADVQEDGAFTCSADATNSLTKLPKKDYKEPWDYNHTYYPTTLPLRRPYSGDPELLDEAEFGEAATNVVHDDKTINPASHLELLEETEEKKMFIFQFPPYLPLLKRPASTKGKEKVGSSDSSKKKGCGLEDFAGGYMGKMLIYKSGAVKLKLGDGLYDVSPGSDLSFAQDVAAINTADQQCCVLGELHKRAVVTPDVDSTLDSVIEFV